MKRTLGRAPGADTLRASRLELDRVVRTVAMIAVGVEAAF